ncbi:hypothetical protein C6I20_06345 [Aeromicrobium sp. A1-2]|uniref:hypothetical protein n=1 Tax=Aeromicrobium sp. A1-2 TaxID=2107713 RepID=UPI000E4B9F2E|nr:hypothetical protein [Aeromicrobium sp. A1-2]AXT84849.1 hypothetical protein C6I20_06345 [Aeromicrobium sp. A1-2]
MRIIAAVVLLGALSACAGGSEQTGDETTTSPLSIVEAQTKTCAEVRTGIDLFNAKDYAGTVASFEKAKVTAKVYATISEEPEADALLDAVEYYANLAPADYPEAARTSENFARNKAITLNQCASDGTSAGTPT